MTRPKMCRWHKILLIFPALCLGTNPCASARPWKPTPRQIAAEYASINHNRGSGEFVTMGWWAAATTTPDTPLFALLKKYVLISVTHSRINVSEPAAGTTFEDIKSLEARDENGRVLVAIQEDALEPASISLLTSFKAGYRRGLGPRGNGTRFFLFDAGAVQACQKGGISVPYEGEIYTWETPFPGCSELSP
jgi:hypothetical protein